MIVGFLSELTPTENGGNLKIKRNGRVSSPESVFISFVFFFADLTRR